MPKMQRLYISEYLDGCEFCAEELKKVMVPYTTKGGAKRTTLRLRMDQRLVISPAYNGAGVLTGFHVNVLMVGERVV